MTSDIRPDNRLHLYLTGEHPCAYLDGQLARTLFVDPTAKIDTDRASELQQMGFRRSGAHFYRPACASCRHCIPVRLDVAAFRPNRSQRRTLRANADLRVTLKPARFEMAHFRLYADYLQQRHADGEMIDDLSVDTYRKFLLARWGGETSFVEFRLGSALLAVAVVDRLNDGLSAVYTFFDPASSKRGLGTHAILTEIQHVRQLGLSYLYLGYWLERSRKMAYKRQFQPLEFWNGQDWRPFAESSPERPGTPVL